MSWTARPAIRADVGLLLGLNGPSGSGKTYSALRLARGLAGDKRFAFIDTEHRRGLIYADEFQFDHVDFPAPFTPQRYWEAIDAQLAAGYRTIVVDSMSHEYAGEGGITDMHDKNLEDMVKRALERQGESRKEWQLLEAYNWPAWKEPKQQHKRLMTKLIALPTGCHLILCFRAEPKSAMVEKDGKKQIVAKEGATGRDGWFPICEKGTPYELTVSHLMLPEKPGLPLPIKCPEKMRAFFPADKPISEETGRQLAEWARGAKAPAPTVDPARTAALQAVTDELVKLGLNGGSDEDKQRRAEALERAYGTRSWKSIEGLAVEVLRAGLVKLPAPPPATTSGTAVVPSGSAPVTVASTPAEQPGLALSTPATSTPAEPVLEERAPWEQDDVSPIDGGTRDEATTKGLIASIEGEVKKWAKVPPQTSLDAIWAGYLGGSKDLAKADPAMLSDILADVRLYTKKDAAAMAKINGYARAARVAS